MANFFNLLKPVQVMWFDGILLGIGGLAHLLPTMLVGVTGFALGPITVQMVVGALSVARAVDLLFIKR